MKKYIVVISLLLAFTVYSTSLLYAKENVAQIDEPKPSKTSLVQFLREIGKTYGCVFTVEMAWEGNEPMNQEEAQLVNKPMAKTNLKLELERLRQQIPNLTYVVNQGDPQLIHIIDQRLFQQKGYGLGTVLTNLDFKGTASDLLSAIHKQGIHISSPTIVFTHETYENYSMLVEVRGVNLVVRDALSKSIPLKNRGAILWVARTELGHEGDSYIKFYR
jgi:hypothetical protein